MMAVLLRCMSPLLALSWPMRNANLAVFSYRNNGWNESP
jgi:hypothetical protein